MKHLIVFIFALTIITGCEEEIELELPYKSSRIVIDGLITNKKELYKITITKTSKYDYKYNPNSQIFIENALVIISDDAGNTDTLTEKSPGVYVTDINNITGEVGRSYSIEILTADGENWVSRPEIMLPVAEIDSIYFDRDREDRSEENRNYYIFKVFVDWQEPANEKNYYLRNFSYYWSNKWHTNITWNWVFDDKYIDGNYVKKSLILEDYGGAPFLIKLKQYSLTSGSYKFWKLVHEQTLLTDETIANSSIPIYGNVFNKKDSTEYALGYFQVSAVDEAIVNIIR